MLGSQMKSTIISLFRKLRMRKMRRGGKCQEEEKKYIQRLRGKRMFCKLRNSRVLHGASSVDFEVLINMKYV
jgi:hypothetical protein